MTYDAVFDAIRATLLGPLASAGKHHVHPQAKLNEDLHLDSVLLINLMLHLEMDHGIEVPEREFSKDDFSTVDNLIRLILGQPPQEHKNSDDSEAEPSEITVHCFVSCLCAAIRRQDDLDYRPFYFGTWDSSFCITDTMQLAYHDDDIDHDFYCRWVQALYGMKVDEWYDHDQPKSKNIEHFEHLLASKSEGDLLVVMLDMYHLPEREKKFNQNPFPHFVIIEPTANPDVWHLYDPDYRWRGDLPRAAILQGINQPTVAGGYMLYSDTARTPAPQQLKAYFDATFKADENPLTDAVRQIVTHHAQSDICGLNAALQELPILSLRKYAYEHAFAYFWQCLGTPDAAFDDICDQVETLCEGFRSFHYAAARAAHLQDGALVQDLIKSLDDLDDLERRIKTALKVQFDAWCLRYLTPESTPKTLEPSV